MRSPIARVRSVLLLACLGVAPGVAQEPDGAPAPGWYETPAGAHVLVSPAPGSGFRRLDFEHAEFGALPLVPDSGGFRWLDADRGGPALVTPTNELWRAWIDAPYSVSEITFEASDGAMLAGVLLRPREPLGRGAVVIHGSGPSDRDNVWAYTFAHALAETGFAVIFPDKRGSGASEGDWRAVGFDQLAHDAAAAARALATRTSLDLDSIGWLGLSQGGWIAPLVTRISGGAAFTISISSAAVRVFDQIAFEVEKTLETEGFSPEAIAAALELQSVLGRHATGQVAWAQYAAARARTQATPAAPFADAMPGDSTDWRWSWWAQVGEYDPIESWAQVRGPVLVVYGAEDQMDNVPVDRSVERLRALNCRPGMRDGVDVRVIPGLGHALVDEDTGWVSRAALEDLVTWAAGSRDAVGTSASCGRSAGAGGR